MAARTLRALSSNSWPPRPPSPRIPRCTENGCARTEIANLGQGIGRRWARQRKHTTTGSTVAIDPARIRGPCMHQDLGGDLPTFENCSLEIGPCLASCVRTAATAPWNKHTSERYPSSCAVRLGFLTTAQTPRLSSSLESTLPAGEKLLKPPAPRILHPKSRPSSHTSSAHVDSPSQPGQAPADALGPSRVGEREEVRASTNRHQSSVNPS